MATIQITPSKDTYLQANNATIVMGAANALWIGEHNAQTNGIHHLLLYFDLSVIPAGSTINSVSLNLTKFASAATNGRIFHVYRVIRAWVENQATWNIAATGTNWGTAGCNNTTTDYNNTSLGSRAFTSGEANGLKTWTLNTSVISQIINGALPYEGFLLRALTEENDAHAFRSREYGSDIPYLEIDYTPPGAEFQVVFIG